MKSLMAGGAPATGIPPGGYKKTNKTKKKHQQMNRKNLKNKKKKKRICKIFLTGWPGAIPAARKEGTEADAAAAAAAAATDVGLERSVLDARATWREWHGRKSSNSPKLVIELVPAGWV